MKTEEEEGLKLAEERLGADQNHCLFVCFSCLVCVSVSRHEEEEEFYFICLFLLVSVLCVCQDMRKRKV